MLTKKSELLLNGQISQNEMKFNAGTFIHSFHPTLVNNKLIIEMTFLYIIFYLTFYPL